MQSPLFSDECRSRFAICAILAWLNLAASSWGQSYDIDWYTLDAGGHMFSSGGGYEMGGTVGQNDSGEPPGITSTGGGYSLTGGFWNTYVSIPCFADLDGNRVVDIQDLAILLAHFGNVGGMSYSDGDLDFDGDVDVQDLAFLLAEFAVSCP